MNNLRKVRRSADETQEALGNAVGLSRQTIYEIEKKGHTPRLETCLKIAGHYKKPVGEIFPNVVLEQFINLENSASSA